MEFVRKEAHHGWIEVITGSMFSGKSEELIRRLRRAQIARQKVQIFKPLIDDRFGEDQIVSHSDMRIASQNVRSSQELVKQVHDDTEVVGIDEGQFFDSELPAACNTLANRGKRVIVACWRWPNTSPRPWRSASSAATRRTTPSAWWRAATACSLARPASTRRGAGTVSTRRWRRWRRPR